MLQIKGLYKIQKNNKINHIDLSILAGNIASIECSREISDMLINLILGKEIPTKGEIYIDNDQSSEFIKKALKSTGIILVTEGFYERLTVEEYLKFFSELLSSTENYKDIMMKLGLLDVADEKISKLSFSQKRRLSFARERLKELKLLIFQEPILNMDKDGARMILENIEELREKGTAVLNTSVSFKDTILLGGRVYTLDENGIEEVYQDNKTDFQNIVQSELKQETSKEEKKQVEDMGEDKAEEKPMYKIEKIPAKLDERILLFNPIEIDYIESEKGTSNLSIRGEKFTCTLTLNELESRLKHLGFFRCHRAYLVNLQRVREIITWTRNSYSLTLDDKNKSNIPLSKGRMDELKGILNL